MILFLGQTILLNPFQKGQLSHFGQIWFEQFHYQVSESDFRFIVFFFVRTINELEQLVIPNIKVSIKVPIFLFISVFSNALQRLCIRLVTLFKQLI